MSTEYGPITITSAGLSLSTEYGPPRPGGASFSLSAVELLPGVAATFQGAGHFDAASKISGVRGCFQVDFTMGDPNFVGDVEVVCAAAGARINETQVSGAYACIVFPGGTVVLVQNDNLGNNAAIGSVETRFNLGDRVTAYYEFDCESPIDGDRYVNGTINRQPVTWMMEPQAPWDGFTPISVYLGGIDFGSFPDFTGTVHRVQYAFGR